MPGKETLKIPADHDGHVWSCSAKPAARVAHRHDELEINLVVRGRSAYLLDDRKYELRANTLIWLFPEQNHVLLEESPDFAMWIAVWKPKLVRQLCATPHTRVLRELNPPGEFCRQLANEQADRIGALCRELRDEAKGDLTRYNIGLGYLLLTSWAAHIAAATVVSTDVHPAVETAARILRDEPECGSVEAIARRSGLSASRLSHLFKEQTGVSLIDFKNKQSLERFLQLYGRGQRIGMSEAAAQAGFGSYAQFHRIFKQLMHCSPSQYRQQFSK